MLNAQIERIPERFLMMYRAELMAWARDLDRHGPRLTVDLIKPPAQSVLHVAGVQPQATLQCTVWKRGAERVLMISPASKMDEEIIERHCAELPALTLAANENRPVEKAKKKVDAVFADMDAVFVRHYMPELRSWGADFARRGPNCTLVLRDIPAMPVVIDGNGNRPMMGVVLSAKVDRARKGDDYVRLLISPESEDDRRKIAKHVADIAKFGPPAAPVGRPKSRATIGVLGVD